MKRSKKYLCKIKNSVVCKFC